MTAATKHKASLSPDNAELEAARAIAINVSAVDQATLVQAVAEARRKSWLAENAEAFAAQSDWHDRNSHPLADILMSGV
jgi:antitoxin CcdA